ncbi:DUF2059 domain-containing protein [Collimonas pratensis]|uniref:DUF2059 domain-containing protein n=1 Tax=Collimonas pratensis TaxID=279113 RepID=A0ABM5Z1J8_9BURK|nr:DUF2059 domain-containing protein [Collimonas pratensis]AMP12966.1 hypothetical protein CPter291_0681 [Collimonas pratensis]
MRRFSILFFAVFFSTAVHAASPSDASIEELLNSMHAEKIMDLMLPAIDKSMHQSMAMATEGKTLSAKQQQILDASTAKMMALMKDEMSWDKMHPMYVQIYRESFTQEEIDGLVAFYKSPAGVAYINKMPAVMQKTMGLMQTRMAEMIPKMKAAIQQAVEDVQNSK